MFHAIPARIEQRMEHLEAIDRTDRQDGTLKQARLRQVPPETGRFLALMASLAPPGPMLEIGTSGGYSSMWLSLACRQAGRQLTSHEVLPEKIAIARETVRLAGIEAYVRLIEQDGLEALRAADEVAFLFLDADKDRSMAYLELIGSRLVPGGLFLADNAISHRDKMERMIQAAASDPDLDSIIVPIGKGVLVCRRVGNMA